MFHVPCSMFHEIMSDILDASDHKIATIGEDGIVRNLSGANIGHVLANGQVYNNQNNKVGYYKPNGYVYKGTSHIGTIHSDGRVYDYENHYLGKVAGDHEESGGAALLLLVR